MNASLSVQGTAVPESNPSRLAQFFSKKGFVKSLKAVLPIAVVATFFPEVAMASGAATDLMKSGDASVKATFGNADVI